MNYKNRIVGHGEKPASQFVAHPLNAWSHSDEQRKANKASLEQLGWIEEVTENKTTGYLLDGHDRVFHALAEGDDTPVPYKIVELSVEEEKLAMAVINQTAKMVDANQIAMAELINEIPIDDLKPGLQEMLSGMVEEYNLDLDIEFNEEPLKDAEPQIDLADELREKWNIEPGQLWQLGQHRLICGDCTNMNVVSMVMGEEKAELVFTDPPYGVAVGDKNKYLNSIARSNRVEKNLANDTLGEDGLAIMLSSAFDNAIAYCLPGASWYVAAPAGPLQLLFGKSLKDRGIWRQTLQWVKDNATFSPMGVCYHWKAEPIFFGWLPNAGHRWYGGRKETTVWEIDRPIKSPEHPTMKPVELYERGINNSTKQGEIVLDPFSGSGTCVIACERLSRKCRAVEIDPGYVAVAIQRWVDVTGEAPKLI